MRVVSLGVRRFPLPRVRGLVQGVSELGGRRRFRLQVARCGRRLLGFV